MQSFWVGAAATLASVAAGIVAFEGGSELIRRCVIGFEWRVVLAVCACFPLSVIAGALVGVGICAIADR